MAVEWTGLDRPNRSINVNGRMHHIFRVVGTGVEVGNRAVIPLREQWRVCTLTLCEVWLADAGSATTVDPALYKSAGASEDTLDHIVSNGSGPVENFRVQTWIFISTTGSIPALVVDPGVDATADRVEIEVTVLEGHCQ